MKISSILALTDFSAGADHALERAARIAALHQAGLRLMYVDEAPDSHLPDRQSWLCQRAQQLSGRHGIRVMTSARVATSLHDAVPEMDRADLIVLSELDKRRFRWSLGARAVDQLVRYSHCPVLIVKNEAAQAYRTLAVGFGSEAGLDELSRHVHNFEGRSAGLKVETFAVGTQADEGTSASDAAQAGTEGRSFFQRRLPRSWIRWMGLARGRNAVIDQFVGQCRGIGADLVLVHRIQEPVLAGLLRSDALQGLMEGLACDLVVVPEIDSARSRLLASARLRVLLKGERRKLGTFKREPREL